MKKLGALFVSLVAVAVVVPAPAFAGHNPLGELLGGVLRSGTRGATRGAVTGAVLGQNVGKWAGAGAAGEIAADLATGVLDALTGGGHGHAVNATVRHGAADPPPMSRVWIPGHWAGGVWVEGGYEWLPVGPGANYGGAYGGGYPHRDSDLVVRCVYPYCGR